MPVHITCANPSCKWPYRISDSMARKSVKCRHCGHVFIPDLNGSTETKPSSPAAIRSNIGPDREGQHITRFLIRQKLGSGAFGTVYRAHDPQLDREIALKVPNSGVLDSPQRIERFLREARAAANLRHPHIVPIYDAGQDGDRYYIASAFVDGTTLADTIFDGGEDFPRAARIARELAEALAYAHEQGIVHRDVKPANIMLDNADRVHLMDFGLASRQEESRLTNDGAILGTPAYMAPEQAAGQSGEAAPAVDQYACGVVLYELLTGQVPFSGPSAIVIHNVLHSEPDRPSKIRPDIPCDLETICLKAMAKRPEDRYPDCQVLADDLRRWQEGEPITARRLGPVERVRRWVDRNPLLGALAATVAGLLLFVAIGSLLAVASLRNEQEETKWALGQANIEKERADEKAQEAAANLAIANEKTTEANRNLTLANEKTQEANSNAAQAAANLILAQNQEKLAKQRADDIELELYYNLVRQAHQEWFANNVRAAEQLLDRCPPALRGWEWFYCKRLCLSQERTLYGEWTANIAYSPDGERLAVVRSPVIKIHDSSTGKELQTLVGHVGSIHSVCFSPDGARLASGSGRQEANGTVGEIKVWDLTTGREVWTGTGHASFVWSVVFRPDGLRIATGGEDGVRIWDAATGQQADHLAGAAARSVAFSPDGRRVAAPDGARAVRVWDLARKAVTLTIDTAQARDVSFSPNGELIATAGADPVITLWDAKTGRQARSLHGHLSSVFRIAFSSDGKRLASSSDDRSVRLWDVDTGRLVGTRRGPNETVIGVAFSPDNHHVAGVSGDNRVFIWDVDVEPEAISLTGATSFVEGLAFDNTGRRIAACSNDGNVRIWDRTTGRLTSSFAIQKSGLSSLDFSPDGNTMALVVGEDVQLLDASTGQLQRVLEGHKSYIPRIDFHPKGNVLASACADGTVRLWNTATGEALHTLSAHAGGAMAVAFNSDGRFLVTGGEDKFVKLWEVSSGKEIAKLAGHEGQVLAVAYSPDGDHVASGSKDGTIRLWHVETRREVRVLRGHANWVTDLSFRRDSRRLASASYDKTVRLWDVRTGREVIALRSHSKWVRAVTFSPEGQDLASAGNDGLVKIWATASEEELAVLTERNKVDKPKGGLQTRSEIRQYLLNDEDADGSITFMREREKADAEQERQVLESTREIEHNPKSATAFNLRGNAYTNLGEFAKAIADYDNAVALAPDDVIILGNRAYALVAKGDFDLAIADCNRAIQTDAKFGFAWFWRGAAKYRKGLHDQGITDVREAVNLEPKNAFWCETLAWYLAACPDVKYRDGQEAVTYATKAKELLNGDLAVWEVVAAAYAQSGNFAEAVRWQRQAIENPNYAQGALSEGRRRLELYQDNKVYSEPKK